MIPHYFSSPPEESTGLIDSSRQLGGEGEAEKDHWHWQNAQHETSTEKVQERVSDWDTEGGKGATNC